MHQSVHQASSQYKTVDKRLISPQYEKKKTEKEENEEEEEEDSQQHGTNKCSKQNETSSQVKFRASLGGS